ncbi:MAG TPA: divergent polysaccharide deacetylase family protein [Candidatus Omnitrophota bacterium]|nr:divergent polysaccharide deacetylase family protein [Candidatus Omnitrophota bacterium]HPD85278.1 divergent polysaccharide deacetylase family protein [Candidatus Omnitrophota bacterium]HRZ04221.1 divergent polysaccharide deacetylase family protein [Candidatus Omnitrophota bacterium]
MAKLRKSDPRNLIILILAVLVLTETYFLFFAKPKKIPLAAPVKKVAVKEAKPPKEKPPEKPVPLKGKIAIIIDDWGYNIQHCELIKNIPDPVTIAVLPKLPHSKEVAQCAHQNGKEVMLHLPMEPQPREKLEKYPDHYIIKTSMRRSEVEKLIEENLDSVPFAAGVNNHMGSKATEDTRLMTTTFTFLKKKELFFVDSLVTSNSICRNLAEKMSLPFTQRDIFLDNISERSYIESQFKQLTEEAARKGTAVGIGHDRALTLEIIAEQIARWKKEGFQFITVKDLIKRQ